MTERIKKYTPESFKEALGKQEYYNYINRNNAVVEEIRLQCDDTEYQNNMKEEGERMKNTPDQIQITKALTSSLTTNDYEELVKRGKKLLYNEKGKYGAEQGYIYKYYGASGEYNQYMTSQINDIASDYGIDGKSFLKSLEGVQQTGCGYALIANAIFRAYIDKPEQFKEDMGYDMYYKDSKGNYIPNVDILMYDIFLSINADKYENGEVKMPKALDRVINIVSLFDRDAAKKLKKVLSGTWLIPKDFKFKNIEIDFTTLTSTEQMKTWISHGKTVGYIDSQYTLFQNNDIYATRDSGLFTDGMHYMEIMGTYNGKYNGVEFDGYSLSTWGEKCWIKEKDISLGDKSAQTLLELMGIDSNTFGIDIKIN